MRAITTLLLQAIAVAALGQVASDRPIVLDGALPEQRRVHGLAPGTNPADALTAGVEQRGSTRTTTAAGNDWSIELAAFGPSPGTGSQLVVEVPEVAPGGVWITFNGNGPYPLLVQGMAASGSDLQQGRMLSIVLADDAFHVLNGDQAMHRPCPTGTVAVNSQYCIGTGERGSGTYFQAGLACAASGLRLCSWGEFVAACQNSAVLQLTGVNNNWEWTNSTANEDNSGRIVGQGTCEAANTALSSSVRPYRCCFTR